MKFERPTRPRARALARLRSPGILLSLAMFVHVACSRGSDVVDMTYEIEAGYRGGYTVVFTPDEHIRRDRIPSLISIRSRDAVHVALSPSTAIRESYRVDDGSSLASIPFLTREPRGVDVAVWTFGTRHRDDGARVVRGYVGAWDGAMREYEDWMAEEP